MTTPSAASGAAKAVGRRFKNPALLELALTHPSRSHEDGANRTADTYERLEFLGDALLGFLVSEWLVREDPEADEGTLTRRKQAVVSQGALAEVSRRLGLGSAIKLGRGEEGTGGRGKPSLLADVFESVLAAVYLDGGMRAARAFVRRALAGPIEAASRERGGSSDTKTLLQEVVQARLRITPRYRIVETSGPAHARRFTAEVVVGETIAGRGAGGTRKEAEQDAARVALETFRHGRNGDDRARS